MKTQNSNSKTRGGFSLLEVVVAMAIASSLDLEDVLALLLEKVESQFAHPSASAVALFNGDTGNLETMASRGLNGSEWKSRHGNFSHGLAFVTLENNASLLIEKIQADPTIEDREFADRNGLYSYLGSPLIAKNRKLGVLAIYTKGKEYPFSKEEIEFVSALSNQAAIAIYNSQLYEETKRQTLVLEKLNGELERANRVKSEFLSVMSHELRTPLHVIIGYAGMIRDKEFGEVSWEQDESLSKILKQSKTLVNMIASILDATKLEADAIKVERHKVGLGDIINEVRSVYDLPLDKAVTITWDYPPGLPAVKSDGQKLKQILQNLISNAVKFTLEGTVAISVRHFFATKTVEFKVADTGIGIPSDDLPVIFEMFRQLDGSGRRSYGGAGLGLYIVKKLTHILGGKIEVHSKVGKGTTFTVTIPYEEVDAADLNWTAPQHSPHLANV